MEPGLVDVEEPVVWKLEVNNGRQIWTPLKEGEHKQTFLEQHILTKKSNDPNPKYDPSEQVPKFSSTKQATQEAVNFFNKLQTEDGHWAGDYGGPMFLLPGLIFVLYITGVLTTFKKAYISQMLRYILNHQNEDGGYGLHIEGHSTIFGTTLNYVAARLLGAPADLPQNVKARQFLTKNGGVLGLPQWGKFYLCTLNLMDWTCVDPIPPEPWLLPNWFPLLQPGKWWCHCRVVYLSMSYIYGIKGTMKLNFLLTSLRDELYGAGMYHSQPWRINMSYVNPLDNYNPSSLIFRILTIILAIYEYVIKKFNLYFLRNKANENALDHILHEDATTNHICIGPVNKVINMLSVYYAKGPDSPEFKSHVERIYDYLWLSDDGMKMQGYNGSQLWDTAFASQALVETGLTSSMKPALLKAYHYVDISQVREDVDNMPKYHRHISKGAWPFSTRDHGWPISDCTGEGLKAALVLQDLEWINRDTINQQRLCESVDVMLSMWNESSGGWASYELTRTSALVEYINPAALFGEIMIDYPHTECSSSCITALIMFQKRYPNYRQKEIKKIVDAGIKFLRTKQMKEGGWYGGWAVCFCYGTWFALSSYGAYGLNYENDVSARNGCDFLKSKQLPDGGWGESYMSNVTHTYVQPSHGNSHVVSTSWALLGLMSVDCPDKECIDRGIKLLLNRQLRNGDFPQESISGVFNHSCMISYSNYRNIFPIWALGMYLQKYKE
ncbi:cycloartenol synthase [Acrasis kona]|uniref:Terpene cyclase/mutase family member n=1 Tax=Acrasis kona TaxID=1008807 RepID=A0AAW2YR94_9EUKA